MTWHDHYLDRPVHYRPKPRRRKLIGVLGLTALAAGFLVYSVLDTARRIGPPPIASTNDLSKTIVDRNGRLLRAFTTAGGRWRLPVDPSQVDARYIKMLFAVEDQRFRHHFGVDPLAVTRAAMQYASNGRIISGASTITMQVARLIDRKHDRTITRKWRQMVRALQLEARYAKRDILKFYLRLAPFGGNLEGVRAASLAYFGKEPRRLSIAESALLVALPQSPEARRPDRSPKRAKRARDRVLMRAAKAGVITPAEALRARAQPVPKTRKSFPMFAPHLTEQVAAKDPKVRRHKLTIDHNIQARLERLARDSAQRLGPKLSVAVLAVDHTNGKIIAHVGSPGYLDERRSGAINMVNAVRSPGSALKPMIYGLAFERGLAHPKTFIEDRPARFGLYAPENFDKKYRGTVTIREALALSLNIPAVKVLNAVGPGRLVGRLRKIGVATKLPDGEKPSLAIALGGVGMTLHDLTRVFAGIANAGKPVLLRHRDKAGVAADQSPSKKPVLSPVAAWYVSDILRSALPPDHAVGGRIAYKTGTSYGHRDAWAVGFDGQHTIGVWVGRADATATPGLMGRSAAAPILFDTFKRISKKRIPMGRAPTGVLRVRGDALPPPLKRFGASRKSSGKQRSGFLKRPVRIVFPPDRAEVAIEDSDSPLMLKASGGVLPFTWMINGKPISTEGYSRSLNWQAKAKGFVKVSVIDAKGQVDRVTVRLK